MPTTERNTAKIDLLPPLLLWQKHAHFEWFPLEVYALLLFLALDQMNGEMGLEGPTKTCFVNTSVCVRVCVCFNDKRWFFLNLGKKTHHVDVLQ